MEIFFINIFCTMNFSEYSAAVIEFKPNTAYRTGSQKISQGCQSDPITKRDVATSREDNTVSIQCDMLSSLEISAVEIEKFLTRVYPVMQKELSLPCRPIEWSSLGGGDDTLKILNLKDEKVLKALDGESLKDRRVSSVWVSTSPILIAVASIRKEHSLYCDHALEHVLVVTDTDATSPLRIPIRACASVIYSDAQVKDILVAGTVLGDIYIWKLARQPGGKYNYVELHYQSGEGMITSLNWFKSPKEKTQQLLISGQIDGRMSTWIYDKMHDKISPGPTYAIDKSGSSVLTPVLIIETISETSFCVHRRGCPLMLYDINNYTITKEKSKTTILTSSSGKECKGIDPLLELCRIEYLSHWDQLMVTSKQGDIFTLQISNGVLEQEAVSLYRTPHINIRDLILITKGARSCVICLSTDEKVELYEIATGARKSVTTIQPVKHISASGDQVLALNDAGDVEIFSLIIN